MQDSQRMEFDGLHEQLVHQHNMEKEDLMMRFRREKEELQEEIAALQRDRDDSLLMAENDKQQVTSSRN